MKAINEISKELNVTNKDIIEFINSKFNKNINLRGYRTKLSEEEEKAVKNNFMIKSDKKDNTKEKQHLEQNNSDNKKSNESIKEKKKNDNINHNKHTKKNQEDNKSNNNHKKIAFDKDNQNKKQNFDKNMQNKKQNFDKKNINSKKQENNKVVMKKDKVKNEDKKNNHNVNMNNQKKIVKEEVKEPAIVILPETMTIKELSDKLKKISMSDILKKALLSGKMYNANSEITFEEASEIALEYDILTELEEKIDMTVELLKEDEEDEKDLVKRPCVVCVMGHVDHGKTSLLDTIRKTKVSNVEAGGITQHIGAYVVKTENDSITFLDTPGHEAFTSMRMRGANSTDIAILVVAADDGVMPQTIEAISHAKAAGIEIIVAINKIDKETANPDRVKKELSEHGLICTEWGGDTEMVHVSARTGEGIDDLLEIIVLTSEILELKANPNRNARGIVIEAKLDKGKGSVATVLVQKGTLKVGDSIVIGHSFGKIRAMTDDNGRRVKTAGPSTPVEIQGLNEVPNAGEIFLVTDNDKEARNIASAFIDKEKEKLIEDSKQKLSLDGLFNQIQLGNIKELKLIIKADVQGSVEAVKQSLLKLSNDEVAIKVIHGNVGAINESDVTLASTSNAIIIGFNVKPDPAAKVLADTEKVEIKLYRVIYNAIEDIEQAMKGMLEPVYEEKHIGTVEIRQLFKFSGTVIGGSYVLNGYVNRNSHVKIFREGKEIHSCKLESLKREKDDVKEVKAGYECGIVFEKYNDIKVGDIVEVYIMEEVKK